MTIYFGNLSFNVHRRDILQILKQYGSVGSISIQNDKYSGWPRKFAYVEMPRDSASQTAIDALNGTYLKGTPMHVMPTKLRLSLNRKEV